MPKRLKIFPQHTPKLERKSSPTNDPTKAKCVRDYIDIVRSWEPDEVTKKISLELPFKENISRRVLQSMYKKTEYIFVQLYMSVHKYKFQYVL